MKKEFVTVGAGLVLAFGVIATGCGKKEAIPVESTQVETVAETQDPYALGNKDIVIEETTISSETIALNESETAVIGEYASGDKVYTFDRYGDLGKGVFDGIASQWVNRIIEDEPTLRETMNDVYGELPTKEELTQEILAMTRADKAQEGLLVPEETQAPAPETKAVASETKATKETPAPTKSVPAETKQEVKQETPPAPQETQPTPVPQETQPVPTQSVSTGDPELDALLARLEEKQESNGRVDSGKAPDYDVDEPLQGITWN